MAAPSKTQLLADVQTLLRKRYEPGPAADRMSVLEAVVFGICHDSITREQANQALSRFKDEFFDWNEVRVSSIREIQSTLAGQPDPGPRAQAIRRFLRQIFNKTYSFSLEGLLKKPLKDAIKALQEFDAAKSDYVLATVLQLALGGHSIPVDGNTSRVLHRLGIAEAETDAESLRGMLERAVPKNRGLEFGALIEELAHDTCVAHDPDCARCVLKDLCPTGKVRLSDQKSAARKAPARKPDASPSKAAATASAPASPAPVAKKATAPKKPAAKPPEPPAAKKADPTRARPKKKG
jgi:endonuclease-3